MTICEISALICYLLKLYSPHKVLESLDIIGEVTIGKECVTKWPIHRRHLCQNRSLPTPALAKLEKLSSFITYTYQIEPT